MTLGRRRRPSRGGRSRSGDRPRHPSRGRPQRFVTVLGPTMGLGCRTARSRTGRNPAYFTKSRGAGVRPCSVRPAEPGVRAPINQADVSISGRACEGLSGRPDPRWAIRKMASRGGGVEPRPMGPPQGLPCRDRFLARSDRGLVSFAALAGEQDTTRARRAKRLAMTPA